MGKRCKHTTSGRVSPLAYLPVSIPVCLSICQPYILHVLQSSSVSPASLQPGLILVLQLAVMLLLKPLTFTPLLNNTQKTAQVPYLKAEISGNSTVTGSDVTTVRFDSHARLCVCVWVHAMIFHPVSLKWKWSSWWQIDQLKTFIWKYLIRMFTSQSLMFITKLVFVCGTAAFY